MQCGTGTRRGQSRRLLPLGFSEDIKIKEREIDQILIPKIEVIFK
jgi:hypothetical protein